MNVNKGTELYNKAKRLIPGGTQLLSKRPEMFLPDHWPSYYKKAKGVYVWDIDDNKYIDMSIMGVGACVLGYADEDVNDAVKKAVDNSSMCTLNAPEEVELAEKILSLHPWAGKVRYARTGGESMSIAVRIARAHTKKDKIIFCGYHGWSDWYLAANLSGNENLNEHLLTGLDPNGVPKHLENTAFPFRYNRIDELKSIIEKNKDIAAIIIEPIRYQAPENNFFEEVRKIANDIGAVLIFDEITSGFRLKVGGAYESFNVNPDMVVYGKAIANGYPMGIIVGKDNIMSSAQLSFISSTFWTERIGPVAALKTIEKIEKENVPEHLIKIGKLIKKGWLDTAEKNNIKLQVIGIDPLATFHFEYEENSQMIHTIFTQEMLKKGFLASKQVYVSFSHTEDIIDTYMRSVDEVFAIISRAINEKTIHTLLEGPIAHAGFKRLN